MSKFGLAAFWTNSVTAYGSAGNSIDLGSNSGFTDAIEVLLSVFESNGAAATVDTGKSS